MFFLYFEAEHLFDSYSLSPAEGNVLQLSCLLNYFSFYCLTQAFDTLCFTITSVYGYLKGKIKSNMEKEEIR